MQKTILINLVLLLAVSAAATAQTRLVPDDYPTIQAAIDDCNDGDTVIVAPDTYTGDGNRDIDFGGRAITVRSTDPNDPDVVAATVIDCNTTNYDQHRGFYFHNGEDANSVLAGFTITNGAGLPAKWPECNGGAIFCHRSSPTIIHCTFSANHADLWYGDGGAIFCDESSPTLTKCTFSDNSAYWDGGAISCYRSSPVITNCTLTANSAERGGGIYCMDCPTTIIADSAIINNTASYSGGGISCGGRRDNDVTISECIIADNSAFRGGGISLWSHILAKISNCTIKGNTAESEWGGSGGAIHAERGCGLISSRILNCNITANAAKGHWGCGGGIYVHGVGREFTVKNCKITGNSATYQGGGIYSDLSSLNITNCTISANSAADAGGIYLYLGRYAPVTITNSILWDNWPQQMITIEPFGTASATYSNVQDGWLGSGNIDADPVFVDPGYWDTNGTPYDSNDDFWVDGDYHLLRTSPCIDAGNDVPVYTDIEGNIRPFDFPGVDNNGELPDFDMGAYELVPLEAEMKLTPQTLNCNSKGNWLKAHFILPEGFPQQDVNADEPAVAEPMGIESEYVKVLSNSDGSVRVEVAFDRQAFCEAVTDDGSLEITVIGSFTTGRYFYATDTIRIIARR